MAKAGKPPRKPAPPYPAPRQSRTHMSEYLDRDPIPAPPLPFEVVETEGEIFIRHRDGKHYIPFRALGELECQYRVRCETICAFMNDAHDIGAREEHRRAKQIDRASAETFLSGGATEISHIP